MNQLQVEELQRNIYTCHNDSAKDIVSTQQLSRKVSQYTCNMNDMYKQNLKVDYEKNNTCHLIQPKNAE